MNIHAEAVYENGLLKLDHPLPIEPGSRVRIEIVPSQSVARSMLGLIHWTGTTESLDQIALDPEFGLPECH
ncbi:MAG: antitoxin family protein [Planctomycetia bacterium]|nr:antitoxin family protein [Planctomycetia bacterium]